ncbi:MAG: hypothetical protein IIY20_00065, partial [Bifidobacteriaceae bacterium]|nr:hypothetical protein [Bifidobacteriaceae bacterium]
PYSAGFRRETVRTNTGKETQTQTGKETAGKRPGNRIKRAKRQTVFARAKNSERAHNLFFGKTPRKTM